MRDELEVAAQEAQAILIRGDRKELERACTPEGWKYINDCYDFHLSALRYKGTFTDFMQFCGETMQSSNPEYVVREQLDDRTAMFFYDRSNPEGVTIAFQKEQRKWRIAGFSPGEIDPKSFFPKPKQKVAPLESMPTSAP